MKKGNLQRSIASLIQRVEQPFDRLKYGLGSRLARAAPYMIIPYLGYGSRNFVKLKGRVIEDKGITPAKDTDRFWHNMLNMYRRFESDEVPHAKVMVNFNGLSQEVVADEEGYLEVNLDIGSSSMEKTGWQSIELELLDPIIPRDGKIRTEGQVLIVPSNAGFGVISDIDDTVVHTGVTSRLRLVYTIMFKNARTRLPLEGVAGFYRALQTGGKSGGSNPLFYVSSSPWNMYDLFREFFQLNRIPAGPMFLRDWGFERGSMIAVNNHDYKLGAISQLLDSYPDLKFILIGDSGEQDPEIYTEVILGRPQRILAAYIRSVKRDERRYGEIRALAAQVESAGSTMILAENTLRMSEHAAEHGWISSSPTFQPAQ